jgi:hypothetical protein
MTGPSAVPAPLDSSDRDLDTAPMELTELLLREAPDTPTATPPPDVGDVGKAAADDGREEAES